MAVDFSGTNTEKIDKLVATIIELRTTLRLCAVMMLSWANMPARRPVSVSFG